MNHSATTMNRVRRLARISVVQSSLLLGNRPRPSAIIKDVMFSGAAVSSEHISGFKGADFEVGVPDTSTNEDYAVFGLTSEERRDHPCYVTVRTENVNDSSAKQDLKKENSVSGKEKSREMVAAFTDKSYGKRSFSHHGRTRPA